MVKNKATKKDPLMNDKKTVVFVCPMDTVAWIADGAVQYKMSDAEIIRISLKYCKEEHPDELIHLFENYKAIREKSKLEKEIVNIQNQEEEMRRKIAETAKQKEELEAQLEALSA